MKRNEQTAPVTENTKPVTSNPPDRDMENDENNITDEEKRLLDTAGEEEEDRTMHQAEVDDRDEDGEPLNESTGFSGRDLDVPGSSDDDDMEDIGEEDEENNGYSTADNK